MRAERGKFIQSSVESEENFSVPHRLPFREVKFVLCLQSSIRTQHKKGLESGVKRQFELKSELKSDKQRVKSRKNIRECREKPRKILKI